MKYIFTVVFIMCFFADGLHAQFSTPGNGSFWTLDSLVTYSNGVVTDTAGIYYVHENVTIADADSFYENGKNVFFTNSTKSDFTLLGIAEILGCSFFHLDSTGEWGSLRLENGSFIIDSCHIENAENGIVQFSGKLTLSHSQILRSGDTGVRLGGTADAILVANTINDNAGYGIHVTSSGMIEINNNRLSGNSVSLSGRPAVFIYDSSPTVRGNEIVSNVWQGVGVWQQSGIARPHIQSNTIDGNLSGITVVNAAPLIKENDITNNKVEGDRNSGAGIFVGYGASNPVITGNNIFGNHYGVALVNGGHAIVGDLSSTDIDHHGNNRIYDNRYQSTVFDLTNETSNPVKAENNYWGTNNADSIAAHILDQQDNAQYGSVDFLPFISEDPLTLADHPLIPDDKVITYNYPNPFNPQTTIIVKSDFNAHKATQIKITNLLGQLVRRLVPESASQDLRFVWDGRDDHGKELPSGVYFFFLNNKERSAGRMILTR